MWNNGISAVWGKGRGTGEVEQGHQLSSSPQFALKVPQDKEHRSRGEGVDVLNMVAGGGQEEGTTSTKRVIPILTGNPGGKSKVMKSLS